MHKTVINSNICDIGNADDKHKQGASCGEDEEDCQNVFQKTYFWRQTLAVSAAIIMSIVKGLNSGYSTTLIPELRETNFPMTSEEASWIASITILANPAGSLLTGLTVEMLGRKRSTMISFLVSTLFWLIFQISEEVGTILAVRFLTGFAVGYSMTTMEIYVSEVTDPKYRGLFLTITATATSLGMLMVHTINTLVDWKTTALICALIPLVCFVSMYFSPESPQWLIKHQKPEEAKTAFYWLRGFSKETEEEFVILLNKAADAEEISEAKKNPFKDAAYWKPMLIMTVLCCTIQWSGYISIEFYSVVFVKETFGANEYTITLVMDAVRVLFSIILSFLSKKVNRRPHVLWSGLAAGLCMLCFAILLIYKSEIDGLVLILLLLAYVGFMTAGMGLLPGVIVVELFPYRLRGLGLATLSILIGIIAFIVVKISPAMLDAFGLVMFYSFYGLACLFGTGVLFFILPETKDKKLSEIEEMFDTKAF